VELFEEIRREHRHGAGSIRAVAKKLGVHRRMLRQALASNLTTTKNRCATLHIGVREFALAHSM
jgi:hypothetical protein